MAFSNKFKELQEEFNNDINICHRKLESLYEQIKSEINTTPAHSEYRKAGIYYANFINRSDETLILLDISYKYFSLKEFHICVICINSNNVKVELRLNYINGGSFRDNYQIVFEKLCLFSDVEDVIAEAALVVYKLKKGY